MQLAHEECARQAMSVTDTVFWVCRKITREALAEPEKASSGRTCSMEQMTVELVRRQAGKAIRSDGWVKRHVVAPSHDVLFAEPPWQHARGQCWAPH
eukprot:45875-Rhodomonas_salina.3